MGGRKRVGAYCDRFLLMHSVLWRVHHMPDTVVVWEFTDKDTIHFSCPSQTRQEKVSTWTKAVEMMMDRRG